MTLTDGDWKLTGDGPLILYIIIYQDSKLLLSALLNQFKLVYGPFGEATCKMQSISGQTSQKGIECTKAKDQLRAYCPNIYTVPFNDDMLTHRTTTGPKSV